jgi:hypothetical protein
MDQETNHKIVFAILNKDFNDFFERDPYYSACVSAATETSYKTTSKDTDFIDKAPKNLEKGLQIKLKTYIKIMHSLYFMHLTNVTASEEGLLVELWNTLGGDTEGAVKAENLLTLLSAVMNLNLEGLVRTYSEEEKANHYSRGFLHFDENNDLYFESRDDVFRLHKKFVQLSLNRKNRQRADLKE